MADRTRIAWCDATINFWWGCQEVSPGCDHCYAKTLAAKLKGMTWGPGSPRVRIAGARGLAFRLDARARRTGKRLRVFTNSMSDFFDNHDHVGPWRDEAWTIIRECTAIDWLILTKRPQNIARFLPLDWGEDGWAHVWLGVSAENQEEADRRERVLRSIPNALPWVSAEPLLAPIVLRGGWCFRWVVIGGESGAERRDCGVEPIVSLARQSRAAHLATFVKQDSARYPDQQGRIPDEWFIREWPASPAVGAGVGEPLG